MIKLKYFSAGIIGLVIIIAITVIIFNYQSRAANSTTTIMQLYQPNPPKGISIISGNVVWYYNNITGTTVILNITSQRATIGVTRGQKINYTLQLAQKNFQIIDNAGIINFSSYNYLTRVYLVNRTGNIILARNNCCPPLGGGGNSEFALNAIFLMIEVIVPFMIIVSAVMLLRDFFKKTKPANKFYKIAIIVLIIIELAALSIIGVL
jgi:hypothetical protein